jgi:hypothetical protein
MSTFDPTSRTALLAHPSEEATTTGLTIIIPAYNEERGIGPVVEQVRAAMDAAEH